MISFRVDGNNLIAMINLPCFEEVFGIWQNAKHLMVCDSKSSKYIAVSFLDDECLHILRRLGSFEIYFSLCVWILWFEVTREFFFLFSRFYSIVYIISAPMSPVFGFLVDKIGKNIIWVLCAVVTTLAAHIMLAFTFWNPWIAMVTSVSKRLW